MIEVTRRMIALAVELEIEAKQRGWKEWELLGVADRNLVTKLRARIKKLESSHPPDHPLPEGIYDEVDARANLPEEAEAICINDPLPEPEPPP